MTYLDTLLAKSKQRPYLSVSVGLFTLHILKRLIQWRLQKRIEEKWHKVAMKKLKDRDLQIAQFRSTFVVSDLHESLKQQVLNSNIRQLKKLLREGTVTVTQIVTLYIQRTIEIAHPLNHLADIYFEQAMKEAKIQDEELSQDPHILDKYELFGIPVSVKDTMILNNTDSTLGLASRCNQPFDYDGGDMHKIKKARGIIFVKTNCPQLAMTIESVNQVFGRSLNPWNNLRAVGGSTGGEGGLISARCSLIGYGSDIGGSLRVPAAFCGVYTLKPGSNRVQGRGETSSIGFVGGNANLKVTKGPLSRSVEDLAVMLRVQWNPEYQKEIDLRDKDFYTHVIPFREIPEQKVKIGIWHSFKYIPAAECMVRGVKFAEEALKVAGYEVVQFELDPQLEKEIIFAFVQLLSAEGGFKSIFASLVGEKPIKEYELSIQGSQVSNRVKTILAKLLGIFGQNYLKDLLNHSHKLNVHQFYNLTTKINILRKEFVRQLEIQKISALVAPGFGTPAYKHTQANELLLPIAYTYIWNLLDLPCGSLPVTVVQNNDNDKSMGRLQNSKEQIFGFLRECLKDSQGLPVNVQVISSPMNEELVLKVMQDIDDKTNFKSKHPYPS